MNTWFNSMMTEPEKERRNRTTSSDFSRPVLFDLAGELRL
jgi:hypothetical protein